MCLHVFSIEFQKTSGASKWSNIADRTQFGSSARLATKRRMVQSSSSQGNMDDTVRRLEQQLQESRIQDEQFQIENDRLQRRAEEQQILAEMRAAALEGQVNDSYQRAEDAN